MWGPSRIVLDVTSFISAEEFILSQNRGVMPLDPFARQCYAEVVQSLIFFDQVLVPHPTLLDPGPDDYGAQPRLLRFLFDLGIVAPLTFSPPETMSLGEAENNLLTALEVNGAEVFHSFVDKTALCDREVRAQGGTQPMLDKIVSWNTFLEDKARRTAHWFRIRTEDGVEEDPFGDWVRQSARSSRERLQSLFPEWEAQLRLAAVLARSLRYTVRAHSKQLAYQAHPARRDFCVTVDLTSGGASDPEILDVIREIRGVYRGLQTAAGTKYRDRLRLLELELPLLGGRLWTSRERGRFDDERWIQLALRAPE